MMSPLATVTAPGVFTDLAEDTYLSDAAVAPHLGRPLSQSGAKTLLRSPAKFAYEREHGRPDKKAYDLGHAAHRFILRKGNEIARVHADDWRSKAAQAEGAAARASARVPLLAKDYRAALDMAKAVKRHPTFGQLFREGQPEVSAYWIDPETGVTCRGRADWLHPRACVDVKTAVDASPAGFAKAVANFRYDLQAAAYSEAWPGLPFVFVVVETAPPHLCAAYVLPVDALAVGAADWHRALRLYAEYESSGVWPGYSPEIETLALPRWYWHQNA